MRSWLLALLLSLMAGGCAEEPEGPKARYTLMIDIEGWGEVSDVEGEFEAGTTITLSATPREGWEFRGWSGDAAETSEALSLQIEGDTHLIARFAESKSGPLWGETAVRKVLQTFAYGGFPTEEQVATWAAMPPEEAIVEMLTFEPVNARLSPPDDDALADKLLDYIPEGGGQLEGLAWYFNVDPDGLLESQSRRDEFHPLANVSPCYTWLMAIQARGLNTFYHRIGFWETNYHMVANQLLGVGSRTGMRHYDNIMGKLSDGAPYHEVLAQASNNAAIALQYGHNFNRWQIQEDGSHLFKGNEDFAREFHQLFFGILGDANRLEGPAGEAYHARHELVTIKNTAKALTGIDAYQFANDQGGNDVEIDFESELALHHVEDLEILDTTISGANAKEKIEALAKVAIDHPESLDNLPLIIISGLADDNLTPEKIAGIQALWRSLPDKDLLAFLRQYAISDLFHSADRVKYQSTFDRALFIRNRMQLSNAELYAGEVGMSPVYWILSYHDLVVFEPLHNVFGHQTGLDAYTSPDVFRHTYRRSTEEIWYYDFGSEPSKIRRDWRTVIPRFGKEVWRVKDVARFLWQRFIADGLKNFGPLEEAHVYALLAAPLDEDTVGVDLGLYLDPDDPNRVYSVEELTTEPLRSRIRALGEERVMLDTVKQVSANHKIQRAVAFIATTPYAFVQEGL